MTIPPPDPPPGTARDELALTGAAPAGAIGHLPPAWSGQVAIAPPPLSISEMLPMRAGRLARRHAHLLASAERVRRVVVLGEHYPTAEERLRELMLGRGDPLYRDPGIPDGGRRTP